MDRFVDLEPFWLDDDVVPIKMFTELVKLTNVIPDGEQLYIQFIELERDMRLQVSIKIQQGKDLI